MSSPEPPINFLLVNEHAEEIKLVSSSLRGFFANCRIEAVYSSDDAVTASQEPGWHIILVDQDLAPDSGLNILARLRRNAPYAAIILQTEHSESDVALHALQSGVDFLLFKNSPAFLTELLFYVQEAIEKRDLQTKLDQTFQRHLRLVESLSDIFYELDREGRFVYVSPSVTTLLGYAPEELVGRHYSMLLPPLEEPGARFRINERRAGSRSIRQFELTLQKKPASGLPSESIAVELTAKGLYDSTSRYLGTVGLVRDLSELKEQEGRLQELESKLRESDRRLALSQEAAAVSRQLQQPLTGLLHDSQRLLTTLQNLKIEQALATMAAHAVQASQLTRRLSRAAVGQPSGMVRLDLNEVVREAAQTLREEQPETGAALRINLGTGVPPILGQREALVELVRTLVTYAQRHLVTTAGPATLLLTTEPILMHHASVEAGRTVFDASGSDAYAVLILREGSETASHPPTRPALDAVSAGDFLRAHQIVQSHGGAIEIDSTREAGLLIRVRIPGEELPGASGDRGVTVTRPSSISADAALESSESAASVPDSPADRRRFVRRRINLPIQLAVGSLTVEGIVHDMSAGGALLVLHEAVPPLHQQPAYLILKTPVSLLELQGVVYDRTSSAATAKAHTKDLAISFSLAKEHDRVVLDSLLDGALAGTTSLTVEGLIPLPEAAAESRLNTTRPSVEASSERREAVRLKLAIPVRLGLPGESGARPLGIIVNVSQSGASVEMQGRPDTIAPEQPVHLLPTGPVGQLNDALSLGGADPPWRGRVIWTRPTKVGSSGASSGSGDTSLRIGVRFDQLSSLQEHALLRLVESGAGTPFDLSEPIADSPVTTVSRTIRNRQGKAVALCCDAPRQSKAKPLPLLILSPAYGHTQASYVALAYYLAARGLRVVRYDHSHHLGLSEGHPHQTTLSSLEDDLDAILAWVRTEWPDAAISLLATDLAGRITLRRRDWHPALRQLLLLHPTLDLRNTLATLHQRDLIHEHLTGARLGIGNLMGLTLDIDQFMTDAVISKYADPVSTLEDLRQCQTDVVLLRPASAADETPIPPPSNTVLEEALQLLGLRGRTVALPSGRLTATDVAPAALRETWERIWSLCHPLGVPTVLHAEFPALSRATAIRYRLERDKLRGKYVTGTSTRELLWAAQTRLTPVLDELPPFWQFIDQMYQLTQPLHEGARLLDVGCGVHSFARLLLLNLSYRLRSQAWRQASALRYVGVDFSVAPLRLAQTAAKQALEHLDVLFSGRISTHSPVVASWAVSRSIESLPFAADSFDRIVANLVVSFAPSPLHALRELFRVLRPGGTLVLSVFTPSADWATLYRPHLQELGTDEFTGTARTHLSDMAHFCEALRRGQLHAFEEESLAAVLSQIIRVPATFAHSVSGQILIATVQKPVSAS